MREVETHILQTGYCKHPQRMTIRDGTLRPVAFPSLSILMIHPDEGPILFDTGYDPAFLNATDPFPERFYRWLTPVTLEPSLAVAAQLQDFAISPTDVRHVVLSHFHADHISGLHAFPNATVHCARAGLTVVCGTGRINGIRQGILKSLVPSDIEMRANFFEDSNTAILPNDFFPFEQARDILGDASLLAIELPGHCPGHWGLGVREPSGKYHMLVADAAWSSDAIHRNVPPPSLTSAFLGNARKTRDTLRDLHLLWSRNPEMQMTPSHCTECASRAHKTNEKVKG